MAKNTFNLSYVAEMCDNDSSVMLDFVRTFITLVQEYDHQLTAFLNSQIDEVFFKECCHKICPTYKMFLLTSTARLVKSIENAGPEIDIVKKAKKLPAINEEAIKSAQEAILQLEKDLAANQPNQ